MTGTYSKIIGTCLLALFLITVGCGPRIVKVNGAQMNATQLSQLDQLHCGHVWDGNYLLDLNTLAWADADTGQSKGNLTDHCKFIAALNQFNATLAIMNGALNQANQGYQQPQRRKSLSERGLLFPSALSY